MDYSTQYFSKLPIRVLWHWRSNMLSLKSSKINCEVHLYLSDIKSCCLQISQNCSLMNYFITDIILLFFWEWCICRLCFQQQQHAIVKLDIHVFLWHKELLPIQSVPNQSLVTVLSKKAATYLGSITPLRQLHFFIYSDFFSSSCISGTDSN